MDEELKSQARLAAVEYLACHTYNMLLRLLAISESQIAEIEKTGADAISLQPIVKSDPALSDHVSALMAEALTDLLNGARQMREQAEI